MSLTVALNSALSGLRVNERTISLISNNIANANTDGYSRQELELSPIIINGQGSGVKAEAVTRKVDEFLLAAIHGQNAKVGYGETIKDYYDQIQILLGEPGSTNSLDEHVENFFNDVQLMAETPERTSGRAAVVESGANLARELSNLADNLEELRFQADREIDNAVKEVNSILEELYVTNEALIDAQTYGNPTPELLDERDQLLEDLSRHIDVRAFPRDDGTVHIYAGQGLSLLDEALGQLQYDKINDPTLLIDDGELRPIQLQSYTFEGNPIGTPTNIVSGGLSSTIESRFDSGELKGLLDMRDNIIPAMLEQIDNIAATLRDEVNKLHNQGTGYPAATELNGTGFYAASERSEWTGSVMIAAMNTDGTPVLSNYEDETSGMRPLTLDLESLYSGANIGEPDLQTIVDEINNHYGVPQNRLKVGNLNNIEMALVSDDVPGNTGLLEFDFDMENISGTDSEVWINSVFVRDDTGTDITSLTDTLPAITLANAGTFTTTANSNIVTVTASAPHGLVEGDILKLDDPGVAIDGIPGSDFNQYFSITNVTEFGFDILVATDAVAGGSTDVIGQTAAPPYDTIAAGESKRLQQQGTLVADVSANNTSSYYDFLISYAVREPDGTMSFTQARYRVQSPEADTMNDRIPAIEVLSGSGEIIQPQDRSPVLRAMLVDENGDELPKSNGEYGDQSGYLKLESLRPGVTIAIDEMDSAHNGLSTDVPPRPGTGRGFSHHFELNNFFQSNQLGQTGDVVKNSAYNMAVEARLREDPSLISTGRLQLSNQPADSSLDPLYTYERFSGDQSIIQEIAELGQRNISFDAAGGLPDSNLTFNAYAAEMLGYMSANGISANISYQNQQTLLDGYLERSQAISGVNLDEELANTIIYQNAYTASARMISVADELMQEILGVLN